MSLQQHVAPGTNAAFFYQFERALWWLAQSPAGFLIGIETNDDVSVSNAEGLQVLEQDKHSIRDDAVPFGNRSKDLWNTLSIWVEALDSKEVYIDTTKFFMVTNKTVPECIARDISDADSDAQIDACIFNLTNAAVEPPKTIAHLIERVLRADSRDNLKNLIKQCELVDASTGISLRKETIAHLQLPQWCLSYADSITDELLGWMHRIALNSWQQGFSAWIQRDHFVNQLHAIIDRRKREIKRERAESLLPITDDTIGQERGNSYVKQIYLVTEDDSIIDNAIRECVRCGIEKMRLSVEGNITDDDWQAFETTLQSRWEKIRARIIRMSQSKQKEEDVGFEIFSETTEGYREKLAGSDTDQVYLTSGTYHRLANMITLGWHPRFKELMQKNKEIS